jgi:hypothetical protein
MCASVHSRLVPVKHGPQPRRWYRRSGGVGSCCEHLWLWPGLGRHIGHLLQSSSATRPPANRRVGALITAGCQAIGCEALFPFTYGHLDISMSRNGFADDASANNGDTYESLECPGCSRVHLVNRSTGRALGDDSE